MSMHKAALQTERCFKGFASAKGNKERITVITPVTYESIQIYPPFLVIHLQLYYLTQLEQNTKNTK